MYYIEDSTDSDHSSKCNKCKFSESVYTSKIWVLTTLAITNQSHIFKNHLNSIK